MRQSCDLHVVENGSGSLIDLTRGISWVIPNRSLGPEFEMALDVGYVRGADLWHIATALYMPYDPPSVSFLSLDQQQRTVAAALGFQT